MRISYDSRRDCNLDLAAKYAKCLLGMTSAILVTSWIPSTKAQRLIRAVAGGTSFGYFFKNAADFGQILQIREMCYPKEGK